MKRWHEATIAGRSVRWSYRPWSATFAPRPARCTIAANSGSSGPPPKKCSSTSLRRRHSLREYGKVVVSDDVDIALVPVGGGELAGRALRHGDHRIGLAHRFAEP